jgi:hypothetical protein
VCYLTAAGLMPTYPVFTFGRRISMQSQMSPQAGDELVIGTRDGDGAGDHDVPYRFGRRPTTEAPFPFSTWQFARLLALRSRIQAGLFSSDHCQQAIDDSLITRP